MNWGVFGAGFATILAQACSVLFLIFYIIHKVPHYHIGLADLKLDRGNLKKHAQLAFPMGFQASIIAIGAMTLQFMVNQLGTDAIAAQAIALRTDQLAMLPMVNLGLAIATFTAQNYGAKLYDRIREGCATHYSSALLGPLYLRSFSSWAIASSLVSFYQMPVKLCWTWPWFTTSLTALATGLLLPSLFFVALFRDLARALSQH